VDFFDDDAAGQTPPDASPPPPPPRRRTNRRRTRIQRIVILAAILFVVVFVIAWWARSCQHSAKVDSYRTYMEGVTTVIADSDALGKQLDQIVENPTKYSRKELIAKLTALSSSQSEIAVRAGNLEAPGPLASQQDQFATGMDVRAAGFKLLRTAMLAALSSKKVGAGKLSQLEGYFSGPDAYYMHLFYTQARTTMSDEGVSDVEVPVSTWYLTHDVFDQTRLQAMLTSVGTSTKLTGVHGVSLAGVVAQPGNVALSQGKTVDVPASAQLSFLVKVKNGGDVTENEVPVSATLILPGGNELKQAATIASIGAGQTQSVVIEGFAIPSDALSKELTLKVKAGPVADERDPSNNSGQFKFILQLQ
jgi:hypothetical protein